MKKLSILVARAAATIQVLCCARPSICKFTISKKQLSTNWQNTRYDLRLKSSGKSLFQQNPVMTIVLIAGQFFGAFIGECSYAATRPMLTAQSFPLAMLNTTDAFNDRLPALFQSVGGESASKRRQAQRFFVSQKTFFSIFSLSSSARSLSSSHFCEHNRTRVWRRRV